jgi:hypothetical protein
MGCKQSLNAAPRFSVVRAFDRQKFRAIGLGESQGAVEDRFDKFRIGLHVRPPRE